MLGHTVTTTVHRSEYVEQKKSEKWLYFNKLSYWWANKSKLCMRITSRCISLKKYIVTQFFRIYFVQRALSFVRSLAQCVTCFMPGTHYTFLDSAVSLQQAAISMLRHYIQHVTSLVTGNLSVGRAGKAGNLPGGLFACASISFSVCTRHMHHSI